MQKISDFERQDYAGMVTPNELRNLAEGLENSNHASEEMARLFKRVVSAELSEEVFCDCIVVRDGVYIQECDCLTDGEEAEAAAWCSRANLLRPPGSDFDAPSEVSDD